MKSLTKRVQVHRRISDRCTEPFDKGTDLDVLGTHHGRGAGMGREPSLRLECGKKEFLFEPDVPQETPGESLEEHSSGPEITCGTSRERCALDRVDAVVVPAERFENTARRASDGVAPRHLDRDGLATGIGAPLEKALPLRHEHWKKRTSRLASEAERQSLAGDERVHERKEIGRKGSVLGEVVFRKGKGRRHVDEVGPETGMAP